MSERTLIILKPSCVVRGLVGEIISRFEKKGLKLIKLKMERLEEDKVRELYRHHSDKPFFNNLIKTMTKGDVVIAIWEGKNSIEVCRKIIGATNPLEALPGTIRGDFATDTTDNLIHAADSKQSYEREIKILFPKEHSELLK